MRSLRHLLSGPWQVHRYFPKAVMQRIQAEIENSESRHMGELRFAVEAGLHWRALLHRTTTRERAIEVFSQLRMWDTEHNTGVLIYLNLTDRQVEIVADRGIHAKVGDRVWNDICHAMEAHFRQARFNQGAIEGIQAITAQLQCHFPANSSINPNELSDTPVVL